jgi:hypothetical protein
VDADSNVETNDENPVLETLEEAVDKKKKKPKQKVGFRDRKVLNLFLVILSIKNILKCSLIPDYRI